MPQRSSIATRLKKLMQQKEINSAELAKRADVKTSFIYDVLSGKSANPSPVKLSHLADALGADVSALLGVQRNSLPRSEHGDYVAIPRITVQVSQKNGRIAAREQEAEPYYFRAAWVQERLVAEAADLRMLWVEGDSMQPTLNAGDLVMINTAQRTATPPGIFVLFDGMGLTIKRLEYIAGSKPRLRISADNPNYLASERAPDEAYIIGRVVWFAREL